MAEALDIPFRVPVPTTDSEGDTLTRRAAAGERGALEALFLHYHRALALHLTQRVPPALLRLCSVDDLIQETFAAAYRSFGRFTPPTSPNEAGAAFFGWLSTIADRQIADSSRRGLAQKRGGHVHTVVSQPPTSSSSVDTLLEALTHGAPTPTRIARSHEAEAAVMAALSTLSPEFREALELRFLQGLSPAIIAQRTGRTEHAVHNLCTRALAALRESVGDLGRLISRA